MTDWKVTDRPPLAPEPWPYTPGVTRPPDPPRCKAVSPAWGWEGEGEQCFRPPHDGDPWHYLDGSRGGLSYGQQNLRLWWTDGNTAPA